MKFIFVLLFFASCASVWTSGQWLDTAIITAQKDLSCEEVRVVGLNGGDESHQRYSAKGCGVHVTYICTKNDQTSIVECTQDKN